MAQLDSDAVVVCAEVSHRPLIERGVREMKIPRARVIQGVARILTPSLSVRERVELENALAAK